MQLSSALEGESVFVGRYAASRYAFWLDSSLVVDGYSRFSFLGDASGPLSEVLSYRITDGAVAVTASGRTHWERGSIFDVLQRRLAVRRLEGAEELPCDLAGGYVGYFGYEMKADCGATNRHQARTPDAVWMLADRLIVIDHAEQVTYLAALSTADAESARQPGPGWLKPRQCSRYCHLRNPGGPSRPGHAATWPGGWCAQPALTWLMWRNASGSCAPGRATRSA